MKKNMKKILIVLTMIIVLLLTGFIVNKAYEYIEKEKRFKEFEAIEYVKTEGKLSYTGDNTLSVENMDYTTQDGIGVKIDKMTITDNNFKIDIKFKFNENINYGTFGYGLAMYDENNNIYQVCSRMHLGENEKYDYSTIFLKREIYGKSEKDIYASILTDWSGISNTEINESEKTLTSECNMNAKDKYPQSKKIYIKIVDLGYFNASKEENEKREVENFNLSDAKWLFEFDIPEEI